MRRGRVWMGAALLSSVPLLAGCDSETKDLKNEVARVEMEAWRLIHTECAAVSDCAAAAVGAKACGGPRDYWVYCRTATDATALLNKLEQARLLEARYNELTDSGWDCGLTQVPAEFSIQHGRCFIESCSDVGAMMTLAPPACPR
jgi:hypothetical protein